jgi:hypothetical protein
VANVAGRRTRMGRTTRAVTVAVVVVAACTFAPAGVPDAEATHAGDPLIVAAGDIACATSLAAYKGGEGTATECRQKHTSNLIMDADHVFMLGDGQYWNGSLAQYQAVYDPTWGRKKAVTFPTPGDHEYQSGSPAGYEAYFGRPAAAYSFDIGSWHWVSLNSEIDHAPGSAQVQWLQQDLAATTQPCIGAFWGAPRFSSSRYGNDSSFQPFWDALYAAHADVVLSGDAHQYERFAKQTPAGIASSDGIRQFVVGTGGRSLYNFTTIQPNSEARGKVFGVLEMRLGAADYSWNFRLESGGTFSDSGTTACNPKG